VAPLERQNANISKVNDFEIAARFSPGPWWGFNGVDDLELSGEVLTWRHYRLFRGKVPVTFAVVNSGGECNTLLPTCAGRDISFPYG